MSKVGWTEAALALALASSSCTGMDHGAHDMLPAGLPMIRPEPGDALPPPTAAQDQDPRPDVVTVDLRAAPAQVAYLPGKPASVWAYNGTVPGPTIEARVGDRVHVHFTNGLPEPTTIHWHGVRVPNDMDGAGRLLQPIAPGASFDYEFVVPDAGLFWYHPHVRSDVQVGKGLYGAIVVRDPAEPALGQSSERLLVLDDVRVDPLTGQVDDRMGMREQMMGREGNLVLVNGQPANRFVEVPRGGRTRLRIVNTATARFFSVRLEGGQLTQIGTDGGLLQAPRAVESLQLVPGERVDVLAEAQGLATLKSVAYERAHGAGSSEEVDLVRFVSSDLPATVSSPLPATLRQIDVLPTPIQKQTVKLAERMGHGGWQFTINGRAFPDVPPLNVAIGTRQLWAVQNDSDMDHPLHVHGFFFQRRGVPEWKDTINVPARSTVDLIVDFAARPGAAGDWMYHCHILEHAEGGMMGDMRVR